MCLPLDLTMAEVMLSHLLQVIPPHTYAKSNQPIPTCQPLAIVDLPISRLSFPKTNHHREEAQGG